MPRLRRCWLGGGAVTANATGANADAPSLVRRRHQAKAHEIQGRLGGAGGPPRVYTLGVPHLPNRALSANSRDGKLDKFERSRAVKDERLWFGLKAMNPLIPPMKPPLRISWTLYVADLRGDWDGWVSALKPWQDALVDIGLLPNDGPLHLPEGSVRVVKDRAKAPCTVLRLEEVRDA